MQRLSGGCVWGARGGVGFPAPDLIRGLGVDREVPAQGRDGVYASIAETILIQKRPALPILKLDHPKVGVA
jgi:hypothetical protein